MVVADQRALATLFALPWRAGPATLVVQNVGGLVLESGGVLEEAAPPAKRRCPRRPPNAQGGSRSVHGVSQGEPDVFN